MLLKPTVCAGCSVRARELLQGAAHHTSASTHASKRRPHPPTARKLQSMAPKKAAGGKAQPAERALAIKTGVVRRTWQDWRGYEAERVRQLARIAALEASGAHEADVRKQREVLEETEQMLPDVQRRLVAYRAELEALVEQAAASAPPPAEAAGEAGTPAESPELLAARALLAEVGKAMDEAAAEA
jgi:tubulin-specific chaperone A